MKKQLIGKTADRQEIELCTLTNRNGVEVGITDRGGTVVSIRVLDRSGKQRRVWN